MAGGRSGLWLVLVLLVSELKTRRRGSRAVIRDAGWRARPTGSNKSPRTRSATKATYWNLESVEHANKIQPLREQGYQFDYVPSSTGRRADRAQTSALAVVEGGAAALVSSGPCFTVPVLMSMLVTYVLPSPGYASPVR